MYKAPKTITNHPGVEVCESGYDEGFDYTHSVWLREGWAFKNGRMAGCRGGNFNTVADFRFANPQKLPDVSREAVEYIAATAGMIAHNFDRIEPKLIKELTDGIRDHCRKALAGEV